MNALQDPTNATDNKTWSLGFSLLLIGMSIGGLARSLHVSDGVSIAMSGASGVMSLTALALFVKAAKPSRRRVIVLTAAAILVAGLTFAFVAIHR